MRPRMRPGMSKPTDVDIALSILDHQLVDGDGQNSGKVDDLEIVEILVGGNAWRSRGLLGRLAASLSGDALHMPWHEVDAVTSVVILRRPAAELRLNRGDARWARLVSKVPGS
jgi:sporulation protein YlmC with PRC-barrel domain